MIREVKIYEASDGTRFNSKREAEKYERLYNQCEDIHKQLGKKAKDLYAVRHDVTTVKVLCAKFIDICAKTIPDFSDLFKKFKEGEVHISHIRRVLSDYSSEYPCLWHLYFRLSCISPTGIEYEQPYYTEHEDDWKYKIVEQ